MVPLKYSTSKDGPTRALFTDQIDVHFWDWKWLISVGNEQKNTPKASQMNHLLSGAECKIAPSFQTTHPATQQLHLVFCQHFLGLKFGQVAFDFDLVEWPKKPAEMIFLKAWCWSKRWWKVARKVIQLCNLQRKSEAHPPQLKQHGGNFNPIGLTCLHSKQTNTEQKNGWCIKQCPFQGGHFLGVYSLNMSCVKTGRSWFPCCDAVTSQQSEQHSRHSRGTQLV